MGDPDFFDFMIEGGDELMNTEACPHCGHIFYLDTKLEWINKEQGVCKCPGCNKEVKI